jgi:hypothetical protein
MMFKRIIIDGIEFIYMLLPHIILSMTLRYIIIASIELTYPILLIMSLITFKHIIMVCEFTYTILLIIPSIMFKHIIMVMESTYNLSLQIIRSITLRRIIIGEVEFF